ncbi:UDP-N-acetylglucosamine 1-carboxyvinyltransferase [Candidatus Saccharibacteria bacterium]|nr:UDP-N-acetylglucosamine 1-carboxyvinyltransferase [Candidatus Saccharibacteria bacterium]
MQPEQYRKKIGRLIAELRSSHGLTQADLAEKLGTSQPAINRVEKGTQNISLEIIARISDALNAEILSVNDESKLNLRIQGGNKLSGHIETKTSKNSSLGLLCASMMNKGKTTLRHVARIEEVNRILEVFESIGVRCRWLNVDNDLEIDPPKRLHLDKMDVAAAKRTRTILMFLGPLLHQYREFRLPFSGGCNIGKRTVEPHLVGLSQFGMSVDATCNTDYYQINVKPRQPKSTIVLTERGDTTTENVVMAAALNDGETIIRNASPNYMVQDVCFFLLKLGVKIEGIGTTILKIRGVKEINKNVEYFVSEDPIEAMSFLTAGIMTNSEITVQRAPIEFLELELATLRDMGLNLELSPEYFSRNGKTRLVDITLKKSDLQAARDKIHALPFPGINMDNLPFLGLIATMAKGRTLVHDWSYENRAIYFTELNKMNAHIELVDPHRVYITGPTHWRPADIVAPPALRPSVVVLLAMLAAPGMSILRDVYNINRGYEDFYKRLNSLGANIESFREI